MLLSCGISATHRSLPRKMGKLADYKKLTTYLLNNNYHQDFKSLVLIYNDNTTDTVITNFLMAHNLIGIYINSINDSTIEYVVRNAPFIEKRKALIFDFRFEPINTNSKDKHGLRLIIEKGIYYVRS